MADRVVDVVVQIAGEDVHAGTLWTHRSRGVDSATFEYSREYLAHPAAYELDPQMTFAAGRHQTGQGRALFGAFTDCAPDRWGRALIMREENDRARSGGVAARAFGEIDYLLRVRDDLRQGALRFRDPQSGAYLDSEQTGVPHLMDLPVLLNASERLERDDVDAAALRALLRGGSSLGGARPKAHVQTAEGRLAIAKFPSPANDGWDIIRWEAVALTLARKAGIRVPPFNVYEVDGKPVLIVERFDRNDDIRIGYCSAMTMLEQADGDQASYIDIAGIIADQGSQAINDLQELWRRVAFSVLISNTDDHLRNHGFLRATTGGWRLSPAFDINPNPEPGPKHLSTAIDTSNSASIEALLSVAGSFALTPDQARVILTEVSEVTSTWRHEAARAGLRARDIDDMQAAFEHDQKRLADELTTAA